MDDMSAAKSKQGTTARTKKKRVRRHDIKSAYALADAKAHLSEILDHVQRTGAEVVVMRHGKPVARLVPEQGDGPKQLGFAHAEVEFLPGWDEPLTFEDMLGE
jgi:prevent-host-death family protein